MGSRDGGGGGRGKDKDSQSSTAKRRAEDGGKKNASRGGGTAGAAVSDAKAAPKAKVNVLVDQPATITGRTGGVYIPPFKLAQMQKDAAALGKATKEYQRIAWEALRKSINGLINKASIGHWTNR